MELQDFTKASQNEILNTVCNWHTVKENASIIGDEFVTDSGKIFKRTNRETWFINSMQYAVDKKLMFDFSYLPECKIYLELV